MAAQKPEGVQYGDPAGDCAQCGDARVWRPCGGARAHVWRRYCLPCARNYRPRYKREEQYFRARMARRLGSPETRAVELWQGTKSRAARKGQEFNITKERVVTAISRGFCEVTGLRFDLTVNTRSNRSPLVPTLDRTDSSRGYTSDNVKVVCLIYNLAKSNWSPDEVLMLASALTRSHFMAA